MADYASWVLLICFFALFHVDDGSAYWLMGANNILTTQRIDPIVNPGTVGTHVHSVLGASNFGPNVTSSDALRSSECTSIPIREDKSNYWFPHLYFQWRNGTFTSADGSAVMYLYDTCPVAGYTTPFPDNFRMISGDPNLRTLDPSSFAQQAVTFICLDFTGVSSNKLNELPKGSCPSGIRAQINFPSCWDGKNVDSPDHKSHVAFLSTGPDNGTCSDPGFPHTLPRIFMEVYWNSGDFEPYRNQAMNPSQPFVFSNGDPTGYGYHADFFNGWEPDVLQRALDECNCNPYGDPTCCVNQGTFTMDNDNKCFITNTFNETTTGTLDTLPGANPVQAVCYVDYIDPSTPAILSPVFISNGSGAPLPTGTVAVPATSSKVVQAAKGTCLRNPNSGKRSVSFSAPVWTFLAISIIHHYL